MLTSKLDFDIDVSYTFEDVEERKEKEDEADYCCCSG